MALLANDPIMSGRSIWLFKHLKHQNLSTGDDFICSETKHIRARFNSLRGLFYNFKDKDSDVTPGCGYRSLVDKIITSGQILVFIILCVLHFYMSWLDKYLRCSYFSITLCA